MLGQGLGQTWREGGEEGGREGMVSTRDDTESENGGGREGGRTRRTSASGGSMPEEEVVEGAFCAQGETEGRAILVEVEGEGGEEEGGEGGCWRRGLGEREGEAG